MDYLMITNKFNPIPKDFELKLNLLEVRGKYFEYQTAIHLQRLLDAANSHGISIKVLSGYRSVDYQKTLWDKAVSQKMYEGYTYHAAIAEVSRTLAIAGHSEHHTGLAVDFTTPESDDTLDSFYSTPQGKWLCTHSSAYGFIMRYPRLKEHITGIDYEPWHYRYVGVEAAQLIKASGLTLDEFLYFYDENTI